MSPGVQQTISSYQHVSYLRVVLCLIYFFLTLNNADGISWLDAPKENIFVEQGSCFSVKWHYKNDGNEKFLSSYIKFGFTSKSYPSDIASRYNGDSKYRKNQKANSSLFSFFGKNNITLMINVAEIGPNITYCCEVNWRYAGVNDKDSRCSTVFVYVVPRITYSEPQLFCRQGDSIKLQCNATGIPLPRVDWIRDVYKPYSFISRSSETVLDIINKTSEGRYCCDAKNGFGSTKACTIVNVIEYQPEDTTLSLVNQASTHDDNRIHIKCNATASPPPSNFIINIENKEYNSSDGLHTIEETFLRNERVKAIAVSCIPCNKYGKGQIKNAVFKLYAPQFTVPIRTQYNMTVTSINMKCENTGNPTPTNVWINADTGKIVSTGQYYKIPYIKCATKTLTFYCHARNAMGNINSSLIHVEVMTMLNCSSVDKGLDKTSPMAKQIIYPIIIGVVIAVVTVVIVVLIRKTDVACKISQSNRNILRIKISRPNNINDIYQEPVDALVPSSEGSNISRGTTITLLAPDTEATANMDNSAYQEPIDTLVSESEGLRSFSRSTVPNDDGYATVEECAPCFVRPNQEENSQYETLALYVPSTTTANTGYQ